MTKAPAPDSIAAKRTPVPAAVLALSVLLAAAPAAAQSYGFGGLGRGFGPPPSTQSTTAPPPPPTLPGATNEPAPAPAPPGADELSPNAALFDAIDRGDIAAARAALARGAELNTRNALGQTPIDLSIDLGRNDITFFLLSLRDTSENQTAPVASAKAPPPARSTAPPVLPPPSPPPAPKLFAGDGGAPDPQAGFLGFDSGPALR